MTTVSTRGTEPAAIGANDQDLAPGTEVGEYRIERVLGKGGFGVVYAAVQPLIGKQVAIKVLARRYSADPAIVSRFVAEARAVNQIRHRNIIDIFSFGSLADGRHYYVMEYLEGGPLDAYLREHGPLPLAEALPILRAIARALDAAHAKGIAHRDLKPENIYLAQDPDGGVFPKLLDFGIAKLLTPDDDVRHRTNTGVPLGTPYYMSPEQCRGKDVDHRTDIYSFGIVTYRVLTGTFPFEGDDYMELLFKQTSEQAPPPSTRNAALSARIDDAIAWMMHKDREQRPPTVSEGVRALDPDAPISSPSITRDSKPKVQPHASDALAATITPESISAMGAPPKRAWRWVAFGLLVAAVGVGVATQMLRSDKPASVASPPAPPAPAPAAPALAPAAAQAEAAAPPPAPAAGSAAVETTAEMPAAPAAGSAAPTGKRRVRRPAQTQKAADDDEPRSDKGDVIHIDSSRFKEGAAK